MDKAIVFGIIVLLQVVAVRLHCNFDRCCRLPLNLKQCSTRKLQYVKSHGVAFTCDFVKKFDETVLRVAWNGDLRLINKGSKGGSARRWFFTMNGQECTDPIAIDTQLHNQARDSNIHRPAYVEGYCRGIPAGNVHVAWNNGDILDGIQHLYNVGSSVAGWHSTVRIIVEEVDVEYADIAIG